jgi:hypothetical protein
VASKGKEAALGVDGVIEWRDEEGKLHRVGGPARSSRAVVRNGSVTAGFIAQTARR